MMPICKDLPAWLMALIAYRPFTASWFALSIYMLGWIFIKISTQVKQHL